MSRAAFLAFVTQAKTSILTVQVYSGNVEKGTTEVHCPSSLQN